MFSFIGGLQRTGLTPTHTSRIIITMSIAARRMRRHQRSAAGSSGTKWLTRQGTTIYEGTHPWRSAGCNCNWLGLRESNQQYPSHMQIDTIVNECARLGLRFLRSHTLGVSAGLPQQLVTGINANGSLNWNATAWEPIDYTIKKCRDNNIRLCIPFTDMYNWYQGGKDWWVQQAFVHQGSSGIPSSFVVNGNTVTGINSFTPNNDAISNGDPQYKEISLQFYRNAWIRNAWINNYVVPWFRHVNQYTGIANKDEPMIAFAQAGNELSDASDRYDNDAGASGIAWHSQFSAAVKAVSPRVLVIDPYGAIARWGGDLNYSAGRNDPNTDCFDMHLYGPSTCYAPGFPASQAAIAASYGKALVFGEYTMVSNFASLGTVTSALGEIEQNSGIVADAFWAMYTTDEQYGHGAPDSEDTAYVAGQDATWASTMITHGTDMYGAGPGVLRP